MERHDVIRRVLRFAAERYISSSYHHLPSPARRIPVNLVANGGVDEHKRWNNQIFGVSAASAPERPGGIHLPLLLSRTRRR